MSLFHTSYAQYLEDMILAYVLQNIEKGFYIDVGAYDPHRDSVTKLFYKKGWNGINIEPSKKYYQHFLLSRPRDINLNIGIGRETRTLTYFQVGNTGLSTFDPKIATYHAQERGESLKKELLPITTLSEVCQKFVTGDIHFLKIDVEGLEEDVLSGMDFKQFRPYVLVIEACFPLHLDQPTYKQWESFLLNQGYHFAFADEANRYYVANEHIDLLKSFQQLEKEPEYLIAHQNKTNWINGIGRMKMWKTILRKIHDHYITPILYLWPAKQKNDYNKRLGIEGK